MLAVALLFAGCTAVINSDDDSGDSGSVASSGDTATLPDFTGQNLQEAQDNAQDLGLYSLTSKDLSGLSRAQVWDRNWQVCSQDPASGEEMKTDRLLTFEVVKLEEDCNDPGAAAEDDALTDDEDDSSTTIGGTDDDNSSSSTGGDTSDEDYGDDNGGTTGDYGTDGGSSSGGGGGFTNGGGKWF